MENFVGLRWFTYLFENEATRNDLLRVLKNTLAISGINIITLWLPMVFAILLTQVNSKRFRRVVQTLTTIPNFLGWVIVYAIAVALFSTTGFVNGFLTNILGTPSDVNWLMDSSHMWLKMWLWGTWKGSAGAPSSTSPPSRALTRRSTRRRRWTAPGALPRSGM